ncbi:polysaccharide deacetylase family protein [Sporosarcina sp. PTS2304]|uniref:polysaccharide deacetylase family protein n=1 Tax=Sporosarcina sp. PTS2304 TaxID=2283194 RepID=UPI000E0DF915|nr:polysaccharide deacetylase family protein [Sporosarcina sp. PTS2304]AXH98350.1 polysaccharide deacetylase family protein [Sporosarcina sp. PTS2304]
MKKFVIMAVFLCCLGFSSPKIEAATEQVVKLVAATPVFKDTQKIAVFSKNTIHTVSHSDQRFYYTKIGNMDVKFSKTYAKVKSAHTNQLKSANPVRLLTNKHVKVYSSPQTKSVELGHLQPSQIIYAQRLRGDYYPIIFGGKTGYIFRKDIEIQNGIPVIMYHDLVKNKVDHNVSILELANFKEQMLYLKQHNWHTITTEELTLWLQKKIKLPERSVLITFDDGYASTAELAYPILKANNFKATSFLIASRINKEGYVTTDQIKNTQDVFSYQNHTYDMHSFNSMTNMALLEYMPRLIIYNDIVKASQIIQEILPKQPAVSSLAYPYGKRNTETIRASKVAGIKSAFTITEGNVFQDDSPFHLTRQRVDSSMSLKDFERKLLGK